MSWQNNIPQNTGAIIYGCQGLTLSAYEKAFYNDIKPLGFILFARNIDTPDQTRVLIQDLRETVGWECPILIDQEGGKVERLRPPHWLHHHSAQRLGDIFQRDFSLGIKALEYQAASISHMLLELGFTVNCTPVLDVPTPDAHDIIGNRAFSTDPNVVAIMGEQTCKGFLDAGITPVIKHIPGHGRATADSHEELPTVDLSAKQLQDTDFLPFHKVANGDYGDISWGMTAHIVFPQIDTDYPATLSPQIINETIRREIGFNGFLVGDDVFMKALDPYGNFEERVGRSIKAGLDAALFCHGSFEEMTSGAAGADLLRSDSIDRFIKAENKRRENLSYFEQNDIEEIRYNLQKILPFEDLRHSAA